MKLLIFTNSDSPETRAAKELGQELEKEKYQVEYLQSETAEAEQKAELYDVYSFPSFVIVRDEGSVVEYFRGTVPRATDIKYHLNQ